MTCESSGGSSFVDLSGFTSFGDQFGDEESVRVLTVFRGTVRQVATEFGVRIAKWLGDGCMLVSVEPSHLVAAVSKLEALTHDSSCRCRCTRGAPAAA